MCAVTNFPAKAIWLLSKGGSLGCGICNCRYWPPCLVKPYRTAVHSGFEKFEQPAVLSGSASSAFVTMHGGINYVTRSRLSLYEYTAILITLRVNANHPLGFILFKNLTRKSTRGKRDWPQRSNIPKQYNVHE